MESAGGRSFSSREDTVPTCDSRYQHQMRRSVSISAEIRKYKSVNLEEKLSMLRNAETRSKRLVAMKHRQNLATVYIVVLLLFSSLIPLQSLLTSHFSLLGYLTLASVYLSYSLASFVYPYVAKFSNPKTTLLSCLLCSALFLGANAFPSYTTLIPAGLVCGVSLAGVWGAKRAIVQSLIPTYALVTGQDVSQTYSRWMTMFLALYHICQALGHIVISLILNLNIDMHPSAYNQAIHLFILNDTDFINETSPHFTNYIFAEIKLQYVLYITFSGVLVLAFFICLGSLQKLDIIIERLFGSKGDQKVVSFSDASQHMQLGSSRLDVRLFLILLAHFYGGLFQAFIYADVTQHIVSEFWGTSTVGYAMACYNVAHLFALPSSKAPHREKSCVMGTILIIGSVLAVTCLGGVTLTPDHVSIPWLISLMLGLGLADGSLQCFFSRLWCSAALEFRTEFWCCMPAVVQGIGLASGFAAFGFLTLQYKALGLIAGTILVAGTCLVLEIRTSKSSQDGSESMSTPTRV